MIQGTRKSSSSEIILKMIIFHKISHVMKFEFISILTTQALCVDAPVASSNLSRMEVRHSFISYFPLLNSSRNVCLVYGNLMMIKSYQKLRKIWLKSPTHEKCPCRSCIGRLRSIQFSSCDNSRNRILCLRLGRIILSEENYIYRT